MLLVASETGHVYTFATRKLQPMITSDAGKALIQVRLSACLSADDEECWVLVWNISNFQVSLNQEEGSSIYDVSRYLSPKLGFQLQTQQTILHSAKYLENFLFWVSGSEGLILFEIVLFSPRREFLLANLL